MSSNRWEIYKWGELCTLLYGKALKGYRESKGNIPVYGTNGRIGFTDKELSSRDGIIIGRKGAYRGVHYSKVPFYVIDTAFYLNIMDNEKLDMKFAYYNLLTKNINSMDSGSAIPSTSREDFYNMESAIPPLEEQKAIAHILSTLDEKIELNNKINKTLEDIAQAIFKHWFVDFEFPNEDGEPYKSSGGEMVESELGMIPKGWEVKSLDQIADFLNGLAMQKYRPKDGEQGIPVIKIKELRQGFTDNSSDLCSKEIDPKYIVNDGDIIFSWSGSLLVDLWCGGKCGLNQHLFKVSSKEYPRWFYYHWIKLHLDRFINIAKSKATTMGHIKRQDLSDSLVVIPDESLFGKANSVLSPLVEKQVELKIESRKLSELRNTLLPKLMSGEIRVPLDQEGDCEEVS